MGNNEPDPHHAAVRNRHRPCGDSHRVPPSRYAARIVACVQRMALSREDAEETWDDALHAPLRRLTRAPLLPLGSGMRRYAFGVARRRAATLLEERRRSPRTVDLEAVSEGPV